MTEPLHTPVVFIVFNRPEVTERVFRAIAQARPRTLLVIADGPRADRQGEAERCAATRAILEGVDWDCELLTNFSETNLGLRRRVSSGLDWVFEQVEEAIILEDDCLPHPTFFPYCADLLERYRDDERVTHIGGTNKQFGRKRTEYSYYFTRYHHIWGWATWRRAWRHYDVTMARWPEVRDGRWLEGLFEDPRLVREWTELFAATHAGRIQSWDYQWVFACWLQAGRAITPSVNLVSNLGFGPEASHTFDPHDPEAGLESGAMPFPLRHPPHMLTHGEADRFEATFRHRLDVRWARWRRELAKRLQPWRLAPAREVRPCQE